MPQAGKSRYQTNSLFSWNYINKLKAMSDLNEIRASHQTRDRILVRTIERMRMELGLSHAAWSDYLQLTEKDYAKLRNGIKPLSAVSLYHLTERLSLSPAALESGKIDYVALVQAHFGNRSYINPDYQIAASSRKFTVVNTLDFVQKFRGSHLRIAANRHFQIHEDFWSDWQNPASDRINIRFLGELWKFLRTRGLSDEDFRAIGFHSVVTHRNTHIGKSLSSFKRPQVVYEFLVGDFMDNIERNHRYRITRLTDTTCVIESRSNTDTAEALRIRETGSLEGCQFKIGLIGSMPTFVGQPAAAVHETHCVHRGDSYCRFFCDFSAAKVSHGHTRRLSLLA